MLGLGNNLIHQRVEKVNPIQSIIESFNNMLSELNSILNLFMSKKSIL
jgi:hypothetical protein